MKRQFLIGLFLFTVFCVVTTSAQNEKKTAYGILLDNTGTLRRQLSDVKNIGKEIVRQVNQRGVISIFNFKTVSSTTKKSQQIQIAEMTTGVEWTQEFKSLNQYIDNLSTVAGQTTLVDAIQSSAEKINSKVDSEKDKFSEKFLLLVTDGEDRHNR